MIHGTPIPLQDDLAARLAAVAAARGTTETNLITVALTRFLDAGDDEDDRSSLEGRLACMSRQLNCLERELRYVNETVALQARYHLAVTPTLADEELRAACAIGSARFEEFARQVERLIREDRSLLQETLDRSASAAAAFKPFPPGQANRRADLGTDRSPGVGSPQSHRDRNSRQGEAEGRAVNDRSRVFRLILRVFLPFAAGYYLSYLFRTISALIAARLTAEFSFGPGALGLLTSAYFLTFAAAQLPIGILLDRYGPRHVQAWLLLIAAGGAAVFALSEGFASFLLGRALIGLGVAAALTAGLKATVLWFPPDRIPLVNGCMVMIGALGAVTATTPSEWLLTWLGWRGLFEWLAVATAVVAAAVYLFVPEAPRPPSTANGPVFVGLRTVYSDRRFWRLAPLSATMIGTAWALQGLWASPWLSDVEALDRAALVDHLFVMAVALSLGALVLGMIATRLRRRNVESQTLFGVVAGLFMMAQLALMLRWPIPSYVLWSFVAAVGATTVLSYAIVAEHFPKELAGRANAALNVFHIGGAFIVQDLIGAVIGCWPAEYERHPLIAYQAAFGAALSLQFVAWLWFAWPGAHAVRPSFRTRT